MSEVRGRRPGGDHEAVVRDGQWPAELVGVDLSGLDVDGLHLGQDDAERAVVAQDVADRRCDLALREDPGRHLVEQWLEEVVVPPVDQRHPNRGTLEGTGGEEPAEPATDDDDVVATIARLVRAGVGDDALRHSRCSTTVWT